MPKQSGDAVRLEPAETFCHHAGESQEPGSKGTDHPEEARVQSGSKGANVSLDLYHVRTDVFDVGLQFCDAGFHAPIIASAAPGFKRSRCIFSLSSTVFPIWNMGL